MTDDASQASDTSDPVGRPEPAGLADTLAFLVEIDRLKLVERRNFLADGSRRENTAEHSWHLGVAAAVLAPFAAEPIDLATAITMALVHDIVEIDAGDTFAYDEHLNADKAAREQAAADRLFAMLPEAMGAQLRALWDSYEAGDTPEARFVMAVDRMAPMVLNTEEGGTAWREAGITRQRVEGRNRRFIDAGVPHLWGLLAQRLDARVAAGDLQSET